MFDGGPRTRVTLRLEGSGQSLEMTRMAVPDPYVAALYARYPETCKPWVEAGVSSHMWAARLPAGMNNAAVITAEVIDEYGNMHSVKTRALT